MPVQAHRTPTHYPKYHALTRAREKVNKCFYYPTEKGGGNIFFNYINVLYIDNWFVAPERVKFFKMLSET